jgi:hypothetical protein
VTILRNPWFTAAFLRKVFEMRERRVYASQTRSRLKMPAFQNLFFTWT